MLEHAEIDHVYGTARAYICTANKDVHIGLAYIAVPFACDFECDAKKTGGKKGKLNQLAANMAVKWTSQVAVALLGSMLMVAVVAGYMDDKKTHWIYETVPSREIHYTLLYGRTSELGKVSCT